MLVTLTLRFSINILKEKGTTEKELQKRRRVPKRGWDTRKEHRHTRKSRKDAKTDESREIKSKQKTEEERQDKRDTEKTKLGAW